VRSRSTSRAAALPGPENLETVSKTDVGRALTQATRETQKGEYHKIRHAEDLLKRVDPAIVRGRCAHCDRFFHGLTALIQGA
jgi:hypothetical protein